MTDQIHRILTRVQKPARYVGGEYNQIVKRKQDVDVRVAFCFPDTYEIGMSNIGMRILYGVMNEMPGVWCERVFAPWGDMEAEMRAHRLPLWALESHDPVRDFDLVAFTLGYEMCYSNVLNMLELSGLPLLAKDRKGLEGHCLRRGRLHGKPGAAGRFHRLFLHRRRGGEHPRDHRMLPRSQAAGSEQTGISARGGEARGRLRPVALHAYLNDDGTLAAITPAPGAPARVKKRIVQDLDRAYFPTKTIVPSTQIVHDRSNLEIFRGCIRGCRFCQAGFCYRPIRAKSADTLCRQAIESLEDSGNSEITLASLSTSDYRELEALADGLLPLLRAAQDQPLAAQSPRGQFLARAHAAHPEGAQERPDLCARSRDAASARRHQQKRHRGGDPSTCATAFSGGWNSVKLYFMLGLPTETDEDVIGIAELVYKILQVWRENGSGKKRGLSINLATAYFVPKPFTPFQWAAQITPEEYLRRVHLLQANLHAKCVDYRYHESDLSRLEAVMARGDRRVGRALLEAHNLGCRLDGWDEYFDYEKMARGLPPRRARPGLLYDPRLRRGRDPALADHRRRRQHELPAARARKRRCARNPRPTAARTAMAAAPGV